MSSDWIGSRVLILGGTGFIGRHMVKYLLQNELTTKIRVVDKTPIEMAWMNEEHKLQLMDDHLPTFLPYKEE